MKNIVLRVFDYDINDKHQIEIKTEVFSPDDFNGYEDSDGLRQVVETLPYPKESSFQLQLAKWAFQKTVDIESCYNDSYKNQWKGINSQLIFNTLLNQIRNLCIECMGQMAFEYKGRNSLSSLWIEVQPKPVYVKPIKPVNPIGDNPSFAALQKAFGNYQGVL